VLPSGGVDGSGPAGAALAGEGVEGGCIAPAWLLGDGEGGEGTDP
jgi:hypothetical protein